MLEEFEILPGKSVLSSLCIEEDSPYSPRVQSFFSIVVTRRRTTFRAIDPLSCTLRPSATAGSRGNTNNSLSVSLPLLEDGLYHDDGATKQV